MQKTKIFNIPISRDAKRVYQFTSNPENLPKWAKAFCLSIKRAGNEWVMTTPMGEAKARFAPQNKWGVLDHYVSPKPGVEIYVPMRVIATAKDASEVVFTLIQMPGMTDDAFAEDIKMVEKDLNSLKQVLES